MTARHPVRCWLARVCSPQTMAQVVDPTLADMRYEGQRWHGYLTLARALAVHVVVSLPARLERLWNDDARAIPRAAGLSMAAAIVIALPFVALPLMGTMRLYLSTVPTIQAAGPATWIEVFVLLLPQALALTVPAAILVAFPVAMRGLTITPRIRQRAMALLLLYAVLTGVVMERLMPRANQAFRVLTAGRPVEPGPNETGFTALRRQMAALEAFHGSETLGRRINYTIHLRLALICAPFPLGLLALALSATPFGRRHPWAIAGIGLTCYFLLLLPLEFVGQTLLRRTALPPPVLAWTPMCVMALLALAIQARTARPVIPSGSPGPISS